MISEQIGKKVVNLPIFLVSFFCSMFFLTSFAFFLSFSNGGVRSGPLIRGMELDLGVAPPAGGGRWSMLMTPPSTWGRLKGAPRGSGGGLLTRPGLLVVGAEAWLST